MLPSLYHSSAPVTVGILGGGQLAKMLAQSAYRLGLRVAIIENGEDSPAGVMTRLEFTSGWNDSAELDRFIDASDVVTLENEFIDPAILERIAERRPVFPTADTVRLVQDKFIQKQTMQKSGIPLPRFEAITSVEESQAFGAKYGFPFVLKTRTFGYDGYGNATIRKPEEAIWGWKRFRNVETPRELMAEEFVPFTKELAVIIARNRRGETAVYPCVETVQRNHICHSVTAPAPIESSLQKKAQDIALAAVEAINGVGVFGVELFLREDGEILFNEIAPRPHNSGHYTIEGCYTSQFENCIRAVCSLPLGKPALVTPGAAMVNLLGKRNGPGIPDSVVDFFRHDRANLHLYGKKDSRIGRKMGHVTVLGSSPEEALDIAERAVQDLIW
jgi:5-(carboxyamino)imidazole ribonucleotide synthase